MADELGNIEIGAFNTSADNIERVDTTWSDTNLNKQYNPEEITFPRLVCNHCRRTLFEILQTGDYQTTARCICGKYYIVHSG